MGIVLAGGKSSRVGENKMELIINKKKVIECTIDSMSKSVEFVTVVTGQYQTKINETKTPIKIVHNQNHHLGMFSSIKTGVSEINDDVFIIPGDYPMVKPETYKTLLGSKGLIRVPVYNGRKGHPIYIDRQLLKNLKEEPIDSNLKVWRDKHTVNYIEVFDKGVLLDIDTIEDYQNILNEKREDDNEN